MKRILLIATGGTIASEQTGSGLAPRLHPKDLLRHVPEAEEICELDTIQPFHLDSTNINPYHWLTLTGVIEENYDKYDGFVISHGTDTLAYTAAALSYLIQNTKKPIVLTGAQKPIGESSTDAKTNLLDSLRFACSGDCGIVVVFGGQVIAGTRARKTRTKSYNAFTSINFPEIAAIHDKRIVRYIPFREPVGEPVFYHRLNTRVFLLKLIPGIAQEAFTLAGEFCDGLVIESYGVGGIPDVYLDELDDLIQKGKTVIMATQVTQEGSDIKVYEVGERLKTRYRLLETYDMTLEASVTKLMWALGQSEEPEEIRRLFCKSINYDLLF
ncbi:MAG: asparaginase [Clostridia bacterium]|nr:asparaginase [Clostridia bacterium]